jgi:hypothetical protein
MIKGTNKRIIEVTNTGSDIFEKALFFVKPTEQFDEQKLNYEASRIINAYITNDDDDFVPGYLRYSEKKKRKIKKGIVISSVISIVLIAFITVCILIQ